MSTLTITHSHAEGTLIDGTSRSDGSKEILKANRWRWSRNLGSWYIPQSRDRLAKTAQINATAAALREAGFDVEVDVEDGYRPTADVEADKVARQKDRVAALEAKADRKDLAAEAADRAERAAYNALPEGGEPIKIGHHSEARHRKAVDKAWNALGKSVLSRREANAARGRADAAAYTTESRYAPGAVARRLTRLTADLRRYERARDGYTRTLYTNSQTGQKEVEVHPPAEGVHRERILAELEHTADQLAYWEAVRDHQLASGAAVSYSRDVVVKGDHVFYVGQWNEVVRVNAKSVTIRSIVGGSWTDRVAYSEIKKLRTAEGAVVRVVDGLRSVPSVEPAEQTAVTAAETSEADDAPSVNDGSSLQIVIKVDDAYSNGDQFTRTVTAHVEPPEGDSDLDEWALETLHEFTGQDASYSRVDSTHDVTVVACAGRPDLVGRTFTFG